MLKNRENFVMVRVNGVDQTLNVNEDLAINEDALHIEFAEQPAKFSYYGALYSEYYVELERKTNQLSQYEATIDLQIRQQVQSSLLAGERSTEAKIAAAYSRDNTWRTLKAEITELEGLVKKLEVFKDAFKQRAQMLWGLGMLKKAELARFHNESESPNF